MTQGSILVIDDSWVILEGIRAQLAPTGYDVKLATGVDAASRLVKNADLCIVDFHMPGLDGAHTVRALRTRLGEEGECVFYLYTSDPDVARQFASHGFDGSFLNKGDLTQLASQVGAVFRTIRMRKLATQMRKTRSTK